MRILLMEFVAKRVFGSKVFASPLPVAADEWCEAAFDDAIVAS